LQTVRWAFVADLVLVVASLCASHFVYMGRWRGRYTQVIAGAFVLGTALILNVATLWVYVSDSVNVLSALTMLFSSFVLSAGFGFSIVTRTAVLSLLPNTVLMMTLVFVVLGGGAEFLVVLRFATVVCGATTLILLCASAIERKNIILYEDLILTRNLQLSAEDLFEAILPRAGRKGLAALIGTAAQANDPTGGGAAALSRGLAGRIKIEQCQNTTVIESDLVGSTALAATMTPIDTCIMLHDLYSRWDSLAAEIRGIVKVTTIGDAYIAVSGPAFGRGSGGADTNTKELGALLAVRMACCMMEEAGRVQAIRKKKVEVDEEEEQKQQQQEEEDDEHAVVLNDGDVDSLDILGIAPYAGSREVSKKSAADRLRETVLPHQFSSAAAFSTGEVEMVPVKMRISCATGTIFGAVLGQRQFQWQVWGPALASAIKFEETGRPGVVHIAPETCVLAKEAIAQGVEGDEESGGRRRRLRFEAEDMSKRVVEATHSEGWEVWYEEEE